MTPLLSRARRVLCRLLVALAMVGQLAATATPATPQSRQAAQLAALDALGMLCLGTTTTPADHHRHSAARHKLPLGLVAEVSPTPTTSPPLPSPAVAWVPRAGRPPAARAPPRLAGQSSYPRGPPPQQA